MRFLEAHGGDPVIASAILTAPPFLMGVSGHKFHNNYLFHVAFIMTSKQQGSPEGQIKGNMHVFQKPIQGAELGFDGKGFDVIATGSLSVEGNGTYSFSF